MNIHHILDMTTRGVPFNPSLHKQQEHDADFHAIHYHSQEYQEQMGRALGKRIFRHMLGQQMPISACASARSDQGLHYPLTESLDTTECMNGE